MVYRLLADAVLVGHLGFILFVVLGAALVVRWRPALWLHLPAAAWAALIQFAGWVCPLTPLENHLRARGGQAGYDGGFIEHYLLAVIYPDGLTRGVQLGLGVGVVLLSVAVYGWLLLAEKRGGRRRPLAPAPFASCRSPS
jgi:hypothetical protein